MAFKWLLVKASLKYIISPAFQNPLSLIDEKKDLLGSTETMATFDDLPFEIADQIVRFIDDTQDLCKFSMTCHRVGRMADRILSQRRRAFRIGFNQEPYPAQIGEEFSSPYPTGGSSEEPTAEGEMLHTLSVVHEYLLSICRHRKLALFPKVRSTFSTAKHTNIS